MGGRLSPVPRSPSRQALAGPSGMEHEQTADPCPCGSLWGGQGAPAGPLGSPSRRQEEHRSPRWAQLVPEVQTTAFRWWRPSPRAPGPLAALQEGGRPTASDARPVLLPHMEGLASSSREKTSVRRLELSPYWQPTPRTSLHCSSWGELIPHGARQHCALPQALPSSPLQTQSRMRFSQFLKPPFMLSSIGHGLNTSSLHIPSAQPADPPPAVCPSNIGSPGSWGPNATDPLRPSFWPCHTSAVPKFSFGFRGPVLSI